MALYDPDGGFYSVGGEAGRRGDFLTSPEVGPLFGAVMARAVDSWWEELGRPDPYFLVEAGAGSGSLARDLLGAHPACAPALRYVLVERSASLRERQAAQLALEPPSAVLGPVTVAGEDEPRPLPRTGPVATSLEDLPAQRLTGVVLANELLDNMPFGLLQRERGRWFEVLVGERSSQLAEVLVPADGHKADMAARLAPDAPDGGRIPLQRAARSWLRTALSRLEQGRVVLVDYADTTPSLARRPWGEWLRTYRAQGRGGHPVERPGSQDVTCEVAIDQLELVRPASSDRSQAEFLRAHGLDDLTDTARLSWLEGASSGGLSALRARSRLAEAAALTDPAGLGAFRVLEWHLP